MHIYFPPPDHDASRKDAGFTLIEILVVIIIIGILAAIAIPMFMTQRQKAADASIQSDLRTLAHAVIALEIDEKEVTLDNLSDGGIRLTPGVSIAVHTHGARHHCLQGSKISGATATRDWFYTTDSGLDTGLTSCSGASLFTVTN